MTVVEKVTYRPCPENPQWTVCQRQAWIDSKLFGFAYAIKKFGIERYKMNIQKTNRGFLFALNRIFPSPEHHCSPETRRQRLCDAALGTAKRAKELAQEKAGPLYAQCEGAQS